MKKKKLKICIIPARKGSKRIKNKNIKLFLGKPIICRTLIILKKLKFFDKIIVSTNSNRISTIVKKLGVEVFVRSEKLSDDMTDTRAVIADAIKTLEKKDLFFDRIFCVYPTSIFVKLNYLKLAMRRLKRKVAYVFSAKEYEHTIFRSFYKTGDNRIKLNFKNNEAKATQSFPKTYHDAAQFYLGWKNSWLFKKKIFDKKSDFVLIPSLESHDIDNYYDWKIAEVLWKLNYKKN